MVYMTDIEINKALALAIGWPESQIKVSDAVFVWLGHWKIFDYHDWYVVGPISAKFDCFPLQSNDGSWEYWVNSKFFHADTPQKAIALAVIGINK